MLSIQGMGCTKTCAGLTRRELLKVGGLGLGGLTLQNMLAAHGAAASSRSPLTGKSVVLLFLHGGPPHIEFFDPKMTAPSEFRSITGEVQTTLPGVTFGGTFPRLATLADKFTVVRSYGSNNASHTYGKVASGDNSSKAAMSAIYARVAGTNHPATGMPRNVHVLPEAVQEGLKLGSNFETSALPSVVDAGDLGKTYQAFDPSGGGSLTESMQLQISEQRLTDRRGLLTGLDNLRRQVDDSKLLDPVDGYQQQAFEIITRGIADAFDLSQEDPATLAMYDTTGLFRMEELTRYYDMKRATNLLGHQMLLARRLCEAGCGFVTVSDCGWDYHANGNSPKQMTGIWPMGNQVDHAVAAFLQDLHHRSLQDDILLAVTGEMGRTPRINNNGGRDHYGELTTLLLAGGGLNTGGVIGQSDRTASRPSTTPYTPKELLGTIVRTLFNVDVLRVTRGIPRDLLSAVESSRPIDGLFR
ncbi:MAG: DUF1501 domain-containing protein [Planctomycetota bacterium]|nr:DUF1501 domain-containing protein [Planctomycetota bacterium]